MKILLIQAYQGRKELMGPVFPLGLCYIATPLSKKHNVSIFDPNLCDEPYLELRRKVRDFKPEIVGISIRNIDTLDKRDIFYYFKTISPAIKVIKEVAPEVRIMVGGSGFSMFANEIMERIPEIDYGVYLEGEETVMELVEKVDSPEEVLGIFYRRKDRVNFTGLRGHPDFDNLPIPRRDLLDVARYPFPMDNVGIQTKRGCPLKCAYCSYPFLNGNRVRLRSPGKVVDEIEYLIKEFGVRQFMFVDGIFNVPLNHAEEICREILKRGLDIEWKAWCDIRGFSEEFLLMAKRAGCRSLPFSPDAASDEALYSLGKGITSRDISRVVKIITGHKDIRASFGFFGTSPGQTFIGVLKTIFMYLRINILLFPRGGATIGWIRIEPHTEIHRIALKEGVISEKTDLLPEKEENLRKLYYTVPSLWLGDRIIELVLWIVNKLLKPALRLMVQMMKFFRHAPVAYHGYKKERVL